MKPLLHLAALGCNIALIEAGGFKWSGRDDGEFSPAHETARADGQYIPPVAAPVPTSPPELKRSPLGKRASTVPGSVCGYLSHDIGKKHLVWLNKLENHILTVISLSSGMCYR